MSRRWHRWLAAAISLPFLVVVTSGCLLQIKRWVPAIQPESKKSPTGSLARMASPIALAEVLSSMKRVPAAGVSGWQDIKAIDIRPALGVARARTSNGFEVQIDLASGAVLSAAPRYSSLLIEIHEGAFFGSLVRNWIFVPSAFATLIVTLTGLWLLQQHYLRKWRLRCSPRNAAPTISHSVSRPSTSSSIEEEARRSGTTTSPSTA